MEALDLAFITKTLSDYLRKEDLPYTQMYWLDRALKLLT